MATNQQPTQAQINQVFMAYTHEQPILAEAQNGNQYGTGALNYQVPIVNGAYATKIRIYYTVQFDYTPNGTSPTAALNAAAPYNIFQQVNVIFGSQQIQVHPYFEKVMSQMRGYNRTASNSVLGQNVSDIDALFYSAPTLTSGTNTWKGYIDVPLNSVHPLAVNGILPIGGSGTRLQIQLVPANQFTGADPLDNVVSTNGTIAVSSANSPINVVVFYRSAKSMSNVGIYQPSLNGLSTVQVIKLPEINPLTGGSMLYKMLTTPYEFAKIVQVIIDGQSSSTFCSASNLVSYEVDPDGSGANPFFKYDSTNGGMSNYYTKVRDTYGQDMDEGVLVFDATTQNVADSSSLGGAAYFNLTNTGYPAARLAYQVNSASSANGITPRVVSYGVIFNAPGITLA